MALSEEARQLRNAYAREWKRNHKDRVRQYTANSREKNLEAVNRYWENKAKELKEGE